MRAHETAQSLAIANDFKQIGLALHNFHDSYKRLPTPVLRAGNENRASPLNQDPQGDVLSSWRYAITSFVAGYMIEHHFDQPWDSTENEVWRRLVPPFGDEAASRGTPAAQNTKMFALIGPDTAFGDGQNELPHSLKEMDADTLLVVEVRNSGVHWMEPGDFDIRTMPHTINAPDGRGISSRHRAGFHVIFADGAGWCLSHDTPFEELEKFFTIDSAKQYDREDVLGAYVVRR